MTSRNNRVPSANASHSSATKGHFTSPRGVHIPMQSSSYDFQQPYPGQIGPPPARQPSSGFASSTNSSAKSNSLGRRSVEETEDDKESQTGGCGPKSPLQWLCELGDKALPGSSRRGGIFSRSLSHAGLAKTKDARSKAQQLMKIDSDDDLDHGLGTLTLTDSNLQQSNHGMANKHMALDSPASSISHHSTLRINTQLPFNMQLTVPNDQLRPQQSEARIVAPNVSKLSPFSAVEVRLESASETVAVLCAVDVLKMRSSFFHDILSDQEKAMSGGTQSNALQGSMLWRDPVVIHESSPFEAAAFLESLHEGRMLFRGEWNFCWARLSVSWGIEDLVNEYAAQITEHLNKIFSFVQSSHWRLNPSVLNGMRIAVFRKGTTAMPTVVTGTISDSNATTAYSKVRVLFDNERSLAKSSTMLTGSMNAVAAQSPAFVSARNDHAISRYSLPLQSAHDSPFELMTPIGRHSIGAMHTHQSMFGTATSTYTHTAVTSNSVSSSPRHSSQPTPSSQQQQQQQQQQQPVIGDVGEPFWVQSTREGSAWTDPDDAFLSDSKKSLTQTDKRIFWEMATALIELPEISNACKCSVRNAADLTGLLKKPEYRVLWTNDGPEILPKDMAAEFVRHAYVYGFGAIPATEPAPSTGTTTTGRGGSNNCT